MSTTSSTVLFATVQDLPEALLVGHERVFIAWFLPGEAASVRETFDRADIDEYERVHRAPGCCAACSAPTARCWPTSTSTLS